MAQRGPHSAGESAVLQAGPTVVREELATAKPTYLHHELPAAGEASLGEEKILRFLLLFGLLDLGQSANRIHPLAIFGACL